MKFLSAFSFSLAFCCIADIAPVHSQTVKYKFPEKTVIAQLDYSCLDIADIAVVALGQGDKVLLDMTSDSLLDSVEVRVGASAIEEARRRLTFIEDERVQQLRAILQKMLPYIARSAIKYEIFMVEDPNEPNLLNAWTHSGGKIYFTTAMLKFVKSDDEIACVIGHEIGHNENRHCAVHFRRMAITNGMWKFFTGEDNATVSQLGAWLYETTFTAFNQKQELESDKAGAYLAYKAGYNPQTALDFFVRLAQAEGEEEVLKKFIRSHPYSETRKKCLEKYLNDSKTE